LIVLWYVGLDEHGGNLRVEADGKKYRGEVKRTFTEYARLIRDRQSMEVDDAVIDVGLVLTRDPIAQCAEVIAEVNFSCGLDAGEDARHGINGSGSNVSKICFY
jgi:hypothetical protein